MIPYNAVGYFCIQVGQRWRVAWRDGTVHLAEIVEIRKPQDADASGGSNGNAPPSTPTASSPGSSGGAVALAGSVENGAVPGGGGGGAVAGAVYVHYVSFDRRLDEWVSMDRVDLAAGPQKEMAVQNANKRVTRYKRESPVIGCASVNDDVCGAVGGIVGPSAGFFCRLLGVCCLLDGVRVVCVCV